MSNLILPSAPKLYDPRDQAELRSAIQRYANRAASTSSVITGPYINVLEHGVRANGSTDDAVTISAIIAQAPAGSRILMPPAAYTLTQDIEILQSCSLIMDGAEITSTAARLLVLASDVLVDGCNTTRIVFENGDPALSLDRAVRVHGNYSGPIYGITGTIAAGDTSFTADTLSEVSGMAANDWLIVGEQESDWQRSEWKQVYSVVGAVVTVTTPFRRDYTDYTIGYYRVYPTENVTVRNLTIETTGTTYDNYGVDAEICRNFTLDNCHFDLAKGMAWQTYMHDHPTLVNNKIDQQRGRRASVSACIDGYIGYNHWYGKDGLPTSGAMSIETSTSYCTFDSNSAVGADLSGIFSSFWCDYNNYVGNRISSDGTSIGLFVIGGVGNVSEANNFTNCLDGIRWDEDTVLTPTRVAERNTSICDVFRNCTRGVFVRTNAADNRVYFPDCDASVGTDVLDLGDRTTIIRRDETTGATTFNRIAFPREVTLSGHPSFVTQTNYGESNGGTRAPGAVGTLWSSGSMFVATNAANTGAGASDNWHQHLSSNPSTLFVVSAAGDINHYTAVAGKADGDFATFWGTAQTTLLSTSALYFDGVKVLGPQGAVVADVAGTASAAYGATEQATLLECKAQLNTLLARARAHGWIAT
jgi:hypothetical protein